MISAEQFLAALESEKLLAPQLLESLRKQVAQAGAPVPATALAKRLVEKKLLAPAAAQRLLGGSGGGAAPAAGPAAKPGGSTAAAGPKAPAGGKPAAGHAGGAPRKTLAGSPSQPAGEASKLRSPGEKAVIQPPGAAGGKAPGGISDKSSKFAEMAPPEDGGGYDVAEEPQELDLAPLEPTPPAAASPSSAKTEPAPAKSAAPTKAAPAKSDTAKAAKPAKAPATIDPAELPAPRAKAAAKVSARPRAGMSPAMKKIVGGIVAVVLVGGAVGGWLATRPSGDAELAAADQLFRSKSYGAAAASYSEFLKQFPQHPAASGARLRRGLSQLFEATAEGASWGQAHGVAAAALPEMASQPDYRSTLGDLATLLPKLAEGLTAQAVKDPNPTALKQAAEALQWNRTFLPAAQRPWDRLARAELSLALAGRQAGQGARLQQATEAIAEQLKAGKLAEALEQRDRLLRGDPELKDNPRFAEAMLAMAEAAKGLVKRGDAPAAKGSDAPAPLQAAVVPVQRRAAGAVGGAAGTQCLVIDGAAYGLEAASGKLLWRRFVGWGQGGRGVGTAVPVAEQPGSDPILVDWARGAVERVDAATGAPRWRQPLPEIPDSAAAVAGKRVLVALPSGRLMMFDLASGAPAGVVSLPQPVRATPVVDAARGLVFAVADQGLAYVLNAADGQCKRAIYIGHDAGTLAAAPVLAGRMLIVPINEGLHSAGLWVFAMAADDPTALKLVQHVPVKGHLDGPPALEGARLAVVSDRGEIGVFDVAESDPRRPLRPAAVRPPVGAEGQVRGAALAGGQLWLADTQLTRFDVTADGKLAGRGHRDAGSLPLQAPWPLGSAVVSVRRENGGPGVLVSAIDRKEFRPLWETRLAVPLLEEPRVESSTVVAATAAGAVVSAALPGGGIVEQPLEQGPARGEREGAAGVVWLGTERVAVAAGGELATFSVKQPGKAEHRSPLVDELTAAPVAFSGGIVLPGRSGHVGLLTPQSGGKLADPFQPPLAAQAHYAWSRPAAVGDQLVIADGLERLYLVGVKKDPKPHLAAVAQVEVPAAVTAPLAAIDKVVYAADSSGTLAAHVLPSLARDKTWKLEGRAAWGPQTVGSQVLVATTGRKLLCLDGSQKLRWQIDLPYGPLAGTPTAQGDQILLASAGGTVWRVAAATGKETAKVDLGVPLGTGPVAAGSHVVVGGYDGSLYVVKAP